MKAERLAKIRERIEAASPGPWGNDDDINYEMVTYDKPPHEPCGYAIAGKDGNCSAFHYVASAWHDRDIPLITHCREDIPYLLECIAELERLVPEADALDAVLVPAYYWEHPLPQDCTVERIQEMSMLATAIRKYREGK